MTSKAGYALQWNAIILVWQRSGLEHIPVFWSTVAAILFLLVVSLGRLRWLVFYILVPLLLLLLIPNTIFWLIYPDLFGDPMIYHKLISQKGWPEFIKEEQIALYTLIFSPIIIFLWLIVTDPIKPFILSRNKKDRYGSAKWGKGSLEKYGLNKHSGMVLGKLGNTLIRSDKPLSTLVLAPPGTGKTAGIVVPTLLKLRNSIVVHDPKGELYRLTAESRKEFSEIILFDPVSEGSHVFNMLSRDMLPVQQDDLHAYAYNAATMLIKSDNKQDAFFIDASRELLTFFIEWMIWKNTETSFPEIRKKFLSRDIAETVEEMMTTEGVPDHLIESANACLIHKGDVKQTDDRQWKGVCATASRGLRIFGDSRIAAATSGRNNISAEMLRQKNISIYLMVRDQDRERLAPLLSMFFDELMGKLLSSEPKEEDQNVTFLLDEFVRLGPLVAIKDIPAVSRSYKVNTIFVAQDYEQITEVYGREAVSIFETNTAYKVIFRQNNHFTAERVSKLIGNVTEKRTSESHNSQRNLGHSSRSVSTSEEGLPLISAQEILNLDKEKCMIVVEGYAKEPILAEIPFWFET